MPHMCHETAQKDVIRGGVSPAKPQHPGVPQRQPCYEAVCRGGERPRSRTGRQSPAVTWVGLAPRSKGLTEISHRKTMASSPQRQLPTGPQGSLIHRGDMT